MTSYAAETSVEMHSVTTEERVLPSTGSGTYYPWTNWLLFVLGDVVGLLSVLATTYLVAGVVASDVAPGVFDFAVTTVIPVMLLVYALAGLYSNVVVHPAIEMQRISAVTATMGLVSGTTVLVAGGSGSAAAVIVGGALIGAVLMPIVRSMFRILCGPLDWWGVPAVVVSDRSTAASVVGSLRRWPEIGLRPVAVVNTGEAAGGEGDTETALLDGLTVTDESDAALRMAQKTGIPYVIIALPGLDHGERAKKLAHYSRFFDHVFVVGDNDGSPALWTTGRSGEGLFGYGVRNFALQPGARLAKRVVDFLGSAAALLLLAPVFATIAALIRLDSKGSVFYTQERMGREGRVFTVLKFRTMFVDAHEKLQDILDTDPVRRQEYEQYHKLQDDPRVTRIGRILRRLSLDELPQIINVLRGEMSLVGPRAYMPNELRKMKGLSRAVLQTPPGITGLWQVSGRNDVSFEGRVDLDVHYIQNWSPWLDMYLFVRTFPVVLSGKGAS